jgi:hypothetical protein
MSTVFLIFCLVVLFATFVADYYQHRPDGGRPR